MPQYGMGPEQGSIGHVPRLRYVAIADFPHVNSYPLVSIEKTMAARGIEAVRVPQTRSWIAIARGLAKLRLPFNLWRTRRGPAFVALMGVVEFKTLPMACWTELVPYCFDCWKPTWGRWESFFRRFRVRLAFFTARQAAEHFAAQLPQMVAIWLPEAVDPEEYDASKPLVERRIDVLELGRRYQKFHNCIREELELAHKLHIFQRIEGQIIFTSASELRRGIGDSKISVCFPSSITHLERSGGVETVTLRYFESFASKCVVVGHCPQELKYLFGYNPVVEIEPRSEGEQIISILKNIHEYQPLVDRNYQRLLQTSTWKPRVDTILHYTDGLIRGKKSLKERAAARSALLRECDPHEYNMRDCAPPVNRYQFLGEATVRGIKVD